MFYFFERNSEYVRYEIRPIEGSQRCDIVIFEDGQPERVEHYPSWEAADARWKVLKRQLKGNGWKGPMGRE